MKLTGNTHSDNEARVDLSTRAERDPLSANAELSGSALFANTSHEDENAVNLVDLNVQDPRRWTPLVETMLMVRSIEVFAVWHQRPFGDRPSGPSWV